MRYKRLKPFPNGFIVDMGGSIDDDRVYECRGGEFMADTLNRALNDLTSAARKELREEIQAESEEKSDE